MNMNRLNYNELYKMWSENAPKTNDRVALDEDWGIFVDSYVRSGEVSQLMWQYLPSYDDIPESTQEYLEEMTDKEVDPDLFEIIAQDEGEIKMTYDIHNLPEEFDPRDLNETNLHELAVKIANYMLRESKWHVEEGGEFGDTGYDQPDEGRSVLLSDWNDVPEEWQDILNHDGYILEWCDHAVVHEGKVWHPQPQHIGDMPKIRAVDGEWITSDDDPQEWIDSSEMTDYMQEATALPNWFDEQHLVDAGYEKQNEKEYESGWYEGQTDDPQEIAKALFENGAESVIFHIPRVGQFDIRFNVWSK